MDWDAIKRIIPTDHAKQVTSRYYIDYVMSSSTPPTSVLDLGCGVGESFHEFRSHSTHISWFGVDIGDSEESQSRPSLEAPVVIFDGVNLPFSAASVECIYSHQVFEHVRHPEPLLAELKRVLVPGGWFIGSTSQLEPYHSRSLWNYTVPGFCTLVSAVGISIREVRPGIDGITLIERAFTRDRSGYARWFKEESPLNQKINRWATDTGRGAAARNNRKLRFCGHFSFLATRDG
jgi:SAM-dependent methyltransferase